MNDIAPYQYNTYIGQKCRCLLRSISAHPFI